MANPLGLAFIAIASGLIAKSLLKPKPQSPLRDDKPTTRIETGVYIPLLIGKRKIGPYIAWVGNKSKFTETASQGGKGISGGEAEQDVYKEDAIHVLAVGPGAKIHSILWNGKKLNFPGSNDPITPANFPSGSSITTGRGDFFIYWGEPDQPQDVWASNPIRLGILSKWPFSIRIEWKHFRLGGFHIWPTIEYVLEVRPYNTTLVQSPPWLTGLGPNGVTHNILGVGHEPVSPYFKVWDPIGDVTGLYPLGGFVDVNGQPSPSINRLYKISNSSYNAVESHYQVEQNFSDAAPGVAIKDFSTWTKDTNLVITKDTGATGFDYPENQGPPDGALYKITETESGFSVLKAYHQTVTQTQFSTGAQRLQLWFKIFDNGGPTNWVELGFSDTNTLTRTAAVRFTLTGGAYSSSNITNLLRLETFQIDQKGWVKVVLEYNTGNGSDFFNPSDPRFIFIRIPSQGLSNSEVWFFNNENNEEYLKLDPGTLRTGITTIEIEDLLSGVVEDFGNVEGYAVAGEGAPEGANPAHALEQLMFETYPHGAGLDKTYFDMNSLEKLGVDAELEGIRTHILLEDGDTFQAGVGLILQDIHAYLAWSYTKEKYEVGLIRDVSGQALPNLSTDLIVAPKPEIDQNHEKKIPNLVVFTFRNVDKFDRIDTVPLDDDALAGVFNNRITERVSIETAGDFFFAEQAAERRQLEILWPASSLKIHANRDAKMLSPGRAFTVEGIDEILRLAETDYDFDTGKTTLTAITDIFTTATGEQAPVGFFDSDTPFSSSPATDLELTLWELPPMLSESKISIMPLRIRANTVSGGAILWASTDDITYKSLGVNVPHATGGVLLGNLQNLDTIIQNGPTFTALGDDLLDLTQTLTDEDWYSGRQILVMGAEIMYLKQTTALGGGNYQLNGIIRARLGTTKGNFVAGTKIFIFPASQINRYRDIMIASGSTLWIKTVPEDTDLVTAKKTSRLIIGKGIRPSAPVALRTANSTNSYFSGEDITVRWDYIHPDGLSLRIGAGFQEAGEPLEEIVTVPGTFRLTWRDGSTTLRTVDVAATEYTYLNADLLSDLGSSPEPDLEVDIEWILNGYKSTTATLLISLL